MKALDSTAAAARASAMQPASYHDFSGLVELKSRAREDGQGDTALRAAAQQFESMFLQEIMRTMRQATIKSDLMESNALDTFEGMFDKEVSMQMAKRGGMGLADMMVQQMKKHLPADGTEGAGAAAGTAPSAVAVTADPADPARPDQANFQAPAVSTQSVLQGREAAGLPLARPSMPHAIQRTREQPGMALPVQQAFPLGTPPQGIRLKSRDLLE